MADDFFDPAQTLSEGDPLREWGTRNLDWSTGRLLQQDPAKAIDAMIKRGIPPPDFHADGTPLNYTMGPESAMGGADDPQGTASTIIRTNPNGTIAGNITSPTNPDSPASVPSPLPPPSTIPTKGPVVPTASNPDAERLKQLNEEQDAAQDAEDEAKKKKPSAGDALADFSKSLSGVKAPTAPPLNPVGTPSVRSPGAISAPNLTNLISLLQSGQVPVSMAPALGKLLVQGKA